jgi:hypothetical protein
MKTKINLIIAFMLAFLIGACGKVKESVEKKIDEKIEEQVQKTTEEVDKQLKQADSLLESAGEQIDKESKIKEALDEEKILKDSKGQWANDAEASSTYGDPNNDMNFNWLPLKMIGKPDVESYSDDGNAWASKTPDSGIEWVIVRFPKSVNASEIRIRQSYNPGAIIKIELTDDKNKNHIIWEGVDKTKYKKDKIQYFTVNFPKTSFKTRTAKITLATNSVPGWNEIDAVQLVGE